MSEEGKEELRRDDWLSGMSAIMDRHREEKAARREAWLKEMGPPLFAHEGHGFWRVEGGVFVVEERANGYHPEDVRQYPTEFIESLVRASRPDQESER